MVEANRNIAPKRWLLLGEYFQQLLADGLSPSAAEQAIRREGHQRQLDCRCHDEAGRQVAAPDNLWSACRFDFVTSWAIVPNIPDPLASPMAEAVRRAQNVRAAVERYLTQGEGSGSHEIPRRPHSRRFFVEVFVELRPVAPIQADADNTDAGPIDPSSTNAVERIDPFIEALKRDRDQLWAEAAQREREGASIVLRNELWEAARVEQEAREDQDPWDDKLINATGTIEQNEERISSIDLLETVLGIHISKQRDIDFKRLGRCMRRLG
jgi:hypothetical protein